MDGCHGLLPLVKIIAIVVKIFWILIPIALIIFGTIDLGKAVIASDEKEVKGAQGRLIKRFIYAALVFFIPMLVSAVMGIVAESGDYREDDTDNWRTCAQNAGLIK
ncbi:MAG: hypothetical protein IJ097_01935 [Bacilli bacterium]|nr:hypothetical protein [Bacilli bacterium]